jgi:probable HAF family extracellular repeat protein
MKKEGSKLICLLSLIAIVYCVLSFITVNGSFSKDILGLGTLGYDYSIAQSINDQGQVVGYRFDGSENNGTAFFWSLGEGISNISTPYAMGRATSINNQGEVTGFSYAAETTDYRGFVWSKSSGATDIGLQPNSINGDNFPNCINNNGEIVGDSYGTGGFLWTKGSGYMVMPGSNTEATSINDSGTVVGSTTSFSLRHAYAWSEEDGMIDLGTLGGPINGQISRAHAINNNGWVVGESTWDSSQETRVHAFLWTESNGMTDLTPLHAGESHASAVNDLGQVVGSLSSNGPSHAFVWTEQNGIIDLNTLLPINSGWELMDALDINVKGQVVGSGSFNGEGRYAYIMNLDNPAKPISINIIPGSDPNLIKLRSKGRTAVAILSTPDFDAPSQVDPKTLTFGTMGYEQSFASCNRKLKDVDRDGSKDDLICNFYTQLAGFQCGDTEGVLRGKTKDGSPIEGRDSVRVVPCR